MKSELRKKRALWNAEHKTDLLCSFAGALAMAANSHKVTLESRAHICQDSVQLLLVKHSGSLGLPDSVATGEKSVRPVTTLYIPSCQDDGNRLFPA